MEKIILFYKYVDILYPEQVRKWQKALCESLHLKGRILLAHEGINGTLGGSTENLSRYITAMNEHPLFGAIDFKEGEGSAAHFPRLRIVVRPEIVNTGMPNTITAHNGGIHITPQQAHELIENKTDDLLLFDSRNSYESAVGTFTDAITPNTKNFRDLPAYFDQNADLFKGKNVLMFCTGGIRCERASAYLKSKGVAQEIYQIEGGIHRYVDQYPNGFFRGKNYVFDGRVTAKVNDDVLAHCLLCSVTGDEYTNCLNASCNLQFVVCPPCKKQFESCCSASCKQLVALKQVPVRTKQTMTCEVL
jgi:predicted sulfurtransferase